MNVRKNVAIVLASLLMFASPSFTVLAETQPEGNEVNEGRISAKDEVIYGNMNATGKVKHLYVVNTFYVDQSGQITDYGNYSDVQNLTDLSEMSQDQDERVLFEAEDGEFYYQGELKSKSLPWDISITYLLDGKEMQPESIAGESGSFEIQITTSANENVDASFFENYMLQIGLTLDPLVFDDIQAPKGTEANAGRDKQITFAVLPEQEEELILSAKVTDFEMDPISISAVPANIAIDEIDLGDMEGEMSSLSDAIRMVNDGVTSLNEGITELNNGTTKLSNGSSEYLSGIKELNQSSGELVEGSAAIRDAIKQVSDALDVSDEVPDMSEMQELPGGLRELAGGLRESATGLENLKEGYEQAYDALDGVIGNIPGGNLDETDILGVYEAGVDPNVVEQLAENYAAALEVKGTWNYPDIQKGFTSVPPALDEVAGGLHTMATQIDLMADGIETGLESMDGLDAFAELQSGLSMMATEYQTFHNGLASYTDGVGMLAITYEQLDSGIQDLSDGTGALSDGASELQSGTEELQEETSDLPGQMEEEVEKMLEEFANEDFEPVSFVSEKNENIGIVQFVLQTEPIEIEEQETEDDQQEEEDKGVWELFLDLFR